MTASTVEKEQDFWPSVNIKVKTPDGTLFVTLGELNGEPNLIIMNIGKAGTSVQAWADAVSRLMTSGLRKGLDIYTLLEEVSGITTARLVYDPTGIKIRSGPEGLAFAIMTYIRNKSLAKQQRLERLDNGSLRTYG